MKPTIILFASARRHGNTGRFTDAIAERLNLEVIDLGEYDISAFDYQHRNRGDDFEPLMERVLQAESVICATPIYWYSVASPMKAFIDRLSDYLDVPELLDKGRALRGKTGYVISTSINDAPDEPFIGAFERTFAYLGMNYGGYINANCSDGYEPERYESDIEAFVGKFRP